MRIHSLAAAAGLLIAVSSCSEPIVPNYNTPTVAAAGADPSSLQLLATGILSQLRGSTQGTGMALSLGIFGREAFNYTPTDGRNTTHYLAAPGGIIDYSGFAVGNFAGTYNNKRNIYNFLAVVTAAPLTAAQKDAANGFAKTIEALEQLTVVVTRDTIGAVVEVMADPGVLAPFVPLDSAYKWISARLAEADAHLVAAGTTAFPFVFTSGFVGYNTPATFRLVNRGIAARVLAYRASIFQNRPATGVNCGSGVTIAQCYGLAVTALTSSFVSTASAAALPNGPFHTFSTSTGDAANGLFFNPTSDIMVHPSIVTDAELKVGGARDNRLIAKVDTATTIHQASPNAAAGIPSTVRLKMYADRNASIKIINNEELILLRAEAEWFGGSKANAIADINFIRVNSGGLANTALTAASSTDAEFVTELLRQRRYSLLFMGFRWTDVRRFNLLTTLPLDIPTHTRAKVMPIPQGECLIRINQLTPALRGPGCP